jgi:E3 ubiquitin-protein ligase BAH
LNLTLEEKREKKEEIEQQKRERQLKTLVIELEQDDEFFKMLMEELQQAATLQDQTTARFKSDINNLESRMTKVVSSVNFIILTDQ